MAPAFTFEKAFAHAERLRMGALAIGWVGVERNRRFGEIQASSDATFTPQSLLLTFSVEIYLKCLLKIIQPREVVVGHKLWDDLLKRAPESARVRVEELYQSAWARDPHMLAAKRTIPTFSPSSVEGILRDCDKSFDEIRYQYEDGTPAVITGGLSLVMGAIRAYTLELKPSLVSEVRDDSWLRRLAEVRGG